MHISRAIGSAGLLFGVAWAGIAAATVVNDPSPARNNRFSSGYPTAPVPNTNPSFIGSGYDWSGVGWLAGGPTASYALLGPRHILYANHYPPGVGATIQFTSGDGTVKNYTVQAQSGPLLTGSDLAVGLLTAPIPASDNIHPHAILFKGYSNAPYLGSNELVYGQTAKIGWNKINNVVQFPGDPGYYFEMLFDSTTPDRTRLVIGDSGSPTFVVTGVSGEMYVAGDHFAVYDDNSGGVDSAAPRMLSYLSAYMAQTGYLPSVVTPPTARWTGSLSETWGTSGNWSGGVVPVDVLTLGKVTTCAAVVFDGAATTQRTINLAGSRTVTGITFQSAAGANAFTISPVGTLTLGEAGLTNLDDEMQTLQSSVILRSSQRWAIGTGGLSVTGSIDTGSGNLLLIEGDGDATLSGAILGSGGLAKDGAGTLTLSSATGNQYAGKTFIHDGTLAISRDDHLGAAPASFAADQLTLDGGTLRVGGTASLNLSANRGVTLGVSGGTVLVDPGTTLVVNSIIAGTAQPLTKSGLGTINLTAASTYSGPTQVRNGSFSLSGAIGTAAASSAFTVLPGATLQLDNSAGNNLNRIGDTAGVTLSGGTLALQGNSAAASSETIGPLTLDRGASTISVTARAGQPATLTTGPLSRTPGATVNFLARSLGGGGNEPAVNVTGLSNTNGIAGGYATAVTEWASIGPGGVTPLATYQTSPDPSAWLSTDNVKVTAPLTASVGSQTVNSLNLDLGPGITQQSGSVLTIASGGILANLSLAAAIDGGTLNAGELIVHQVGIGTLTINSVISGGALVKSGSGLLIITNPGNNYTGPTVVNAGTLRFGAAGAVPGGSSLTVESDAICDLAGNPQTLASITLYDGILRSTGALTTLSLSGTAGTVTYAGAASGGVISVGTLDLATGSAGPASHAFSIADGEADADLQINAVIADGSDHSQSLVKTGPGTLVLGSANVYTGSTLVLAGTLALGTSNAVPSGSNVVVNGGTFSIGSLSDSAGIVSLLRGTISGTTGTLSGSAYDLRSGAVSAMLGGSGALTKTTAGTVTLTGVNSYSGGTSLDGGVLSVGSDANLGAVGASLVFDGGTLQITGSGMTSTSRPIVWNAGGGGFDVADANNTFTLSSSQSLLGSGPLTKAGIGTLQVAGSVGSRSVTIEDGTLRLMAKNSFAASPTVSLGATAILDLAGNDNAVGGLTFSGGTVTTGAGTLALAGDVIYNRSIWPATIAGQLDLASAMRTFNIHHGSSTDLTLTATVLGSGGVSKIGDGVLTLSAANTYTGATTVSSGALKLANSLALGASGVGTTVLSGGALDLNGQTVADEPLSLQGAGSGTGALINGSTPTSATVTGPVSLSAAATVGGPGSIVLSGPVNYGGSVLSKAGNATLTLSGSQAWGSGSGATVQAGTLLFNQAIGATTSVAAAGSTLSIAAGATVNVNATNSDPFTDSVATSRHLQVANDSTAGPNSNPGLNIVAGAVALAGISGAGNTGLQSATRLTADFVRQHQLSIGNGSVATIRATPTPNQSADTSRLSGLSIIGGTVPAGTLDLNNNSLIIDYTGPVGTTLSNLTNQIKSGRNGVDANDQANWNGKGVITTAGRAANAAVLIDLYNIGAINNADLTTAGIEHPMTTFAGQAVTTNTVLVKYTYNGDANLNGVVDGDDYTYWLNGFLGTTSASVQGWLRGDFNYDGVVDGDDYTQWLNSFLRGGTPVALRATAPVPEPAALLLLLVFGAAWASWRVAKRVARVLLVR